MFMPDPNDPTFTMVRYMSHVELTEWRKALEPFVAGGCLQIHNVLVCQGRVAPAALCH